MYESTMFQGVAFKPLSDEAAFGAGNGPEDLLEPREPGTSIDQIAIDYINGASPDWRNDPLVLDAGEWRRADDREWAAHTDYCIEYVVQRLKALPNIGFRRLPG